MLNNSTTKFCPHAVSTRCRIRGSGRWFNSSQGDDACGGFWPWTTNRPHNINGGQTKPPCLKIIRYMGPNIYTENTNHTGGARKTKNVWCPEDEKRVVPQVVPGRRKTCGAPGMVPTNFKSCFSNRNLWAPCSGHRQILVAGPVQGNLLLGLPRKIQGNWSWVKFYGSHKKRNIHQNQS